MTSAVVIGSFAYLCMLLSPEVALTDYRKG